MRDIFRKIVEELNSISSSLKIIADAHKPVRSEMAIRSMTCETIPTNKKALVTFELGGHGWEKLKKSKEFSRFIEKIHECQELDDQKL